VSCFDRGRRGNDLGFESKSNRLSVLQPRPCRRRGGGFGRPPQPRRPSLLPHRRRVGVGGNGAEQGIGKRGSGGNVGGGLRIESV